LDHQSTLSLAVSDDAVPGADRHPEVLVTLEIAADAVGRDEHEPTVLVHLQVSVDDRVPHRQLATLHRPLQVAPDLGVTDGHGAALGELQVPLDRRTTRYRDVSGTLAFDVTMDRRPAREQRPSRSDRHVAGDGGSLESAGRLSWDMDVRDGDVSEPAPAVVG
jgi:hypothetical protein